MTAAPQSAPLAKRLVAAWHERAVLLKAISFALVGVVNTLVDAGVFFLALWALVGSPSRANAVTLIVANTFSWSIAISGSYVMNSFVTFAVESGRQLRLKSYATFVAGGIVGAIGNTAALVVVAQFAPVWVAKVCAILVSFVLNFSMSHFVVFRPRSADAIPPEARPRAES
jgi:putative flippase GtrA